jgi:hypothetical protein
MNIRHFIAAIFLLSGIAVADVTKPDSPVLLDVLSNKGNYVLGINISAITYYSSEWPFVDSMKSSGAWVSNRTGFKWGAGGPLALTPDGWVAYLDPDQKATLPVNTIPQRPAGDYVVLYDGEGEFTFPLGKAKVISKQPGRVVVNYPADGGIWLDLLKTNPSNPIRNIRFIKPGFETSYRSQTFHPLFLERLSRYKSVRFMGLMRTNNSLEQKWENRMKVTNAQYFSMPVEIAVKLANTLNADPWFTMPHLADDDYVRQFATLVRARLNPNLKVYIEYSNETWNSQFKQYAYMGQKAAELGIGTNAYTHGALYYSQRSVEIFDIWESVFEGNERLVRVLASQAANASLSRNIVRWQNAYLKADALAIAPYFQTPLTAGITTDQVIDGCRAYINGTVKTWLTRQKAVAQEFGLDLIAYEGGQHLMVKQPHINSPENQALTDVAIAANRDPRMYDLYIEYLNLWKAMGGGIMMHLSSVGGPSRYGMWGSLEYQDQPLTSAPKYRALMDYIDANLQAN